MKNFPRIFVSAAIVAWALVAWPAHAQDKPVVETVKLPDSDVSFDMIAVKMPNGKKLWVGKTEVTWDEYDVFSFDIEFEELAKGEQPAPDAIARPSKPYGERYRGFGKEGHPVLGIHDRAAVIYCRWLSAKTGKKYRLPTEAEWDWACRAGEKDPKPNLDDVAWYVKNAEEKPRIVAQKKPNGWGLYDMLGNLAEWAIDKSGKPVTCGGSFKSEAKDVHCGARKYYDPVWQTTDAQFPKSVWWLSEGEMVGFRVVREE